MLWALVMRTAQGVDRHTAAGSSYCLQGSHCNANGPEIVPQNSEISLVSPLDCKTLWVIVDYSELHTAYRARLASSTAQECSHPDSSVQENHIFSNRFHRVLTYSAYRDVNPTCASLTQHH